jgi:lysozyme
MTLRDDILAQARARSGLRYSLDPLPDGITTTDCSLLVRDSVRAAGAGNLPRTAERQRQAAILIGWDDVLPGDLLFFEHTYEPNDSPGPDGRTASHVGFSLGKGTGRMIDAHDREGARPAVGETDITTDWWRPKLIGAYRLPALAGVPAPAPITPPGGPVNVATMPRGCDVASYQGRPDWSAVAASGLAFAFTKVTEDDGAGAAYVNPTFSYNWSGIQAAGLIRGAYHFARPTVNDAVAEADFWIDHVEAAGGLAAGDLLALDMEAGAGDLGQWTLDCLRHVEQRVGFKPLVYTGAWFSGPHNFAAYPALGDYPLWLAAYQAAMPPPPEPWPWVSFWQFTDALTVPGISGDVDGDVFNGSADRIRLLGKPGAAPAPVPTPAPTPAPPSPTPGPDPRDALITDLKRQVAGLISAVAYIGDDKADALQAVVDELRRVRAEQVGPRPK